MKLLLFLDYDGTLTPIVKKPRLAKLTKARRSFLKKISKNKKITLVIISGRILSDITKRVGIKGVYYVGNHGFEITGPKLKFTHPKARVVKPLLRKIKKELALRLQGIKGIIIEDKTLTMSLHYRLVKPLYLKKVRETFWKVVSPFYRAKKIRITKGKKVFEIRPNARWDKGQAVLLLIKKMKSREKMLPVYIGDDTTDEDAFKVLKKRGLTVRVGEQKGSAAKHWLKDVDQVYKLLRILALEI